MPGPLRLTLVMCAGLAGLAGCSSVAKTGDAAAVAPAAQARIGAWGVDLAARDLAVAPGEDFFRYANGQWLANTEIPADRARWGSFDALADEAEQQLRGIVEALPAQAAAGSPEQKVGDTYRAYLDTARIEALGLAPAQPALEAIGKAATHEDIARLMGRPDMPVRSPIAYGIAIDQKNPDRYIVTLTQSGLGMPDRDYYLKDDERLKETRDKYRAHIERLLQLAGQPDPAVAARAILDVETQIATIHWPAAKRRERDLTYNLRSGEALGQLSPAFPWQVLLGAAGVGGRTDYVVRELDAVEALGKLFGRIPVATWRSYLTYHYLAGVASLLPKALDDERFDFYGRTLSGQPEQRERWKRAIAEANGNVGEALGQLYVARHFPPDSKQKMDELVENLRAAYAARIKTLTWMSEPTKQVALEKLAAFRPKIGYPDVWLDYAGLDVKADDAFGNHTRAAVFDWQRQVDRLDKPTDRDEWRMTPQTVNAYYNSTLNEIVFPAAILRGIL